MPEVATDDDTRLSCVSPREYRVVTLLSAEEYIALTHTCERVGLKQSSYIRMLLKRDMEKVADAALEAMALGSTDPAQNMHR